jgi:predicted nucleic acid-binding protein
VAATGIENSMPLCTGNNRHFKDVADLQLAVFRP